MTFAAILALVLAPAGAIAAPALQRSCAFEGRVIGPVVDILERDPAWAKDWGVPARLEIELLRLEAAGGDCEARDFRLPEGMASPAAGLCLRGRARIAGDEFEGVHHRIEAMDVIPCR